jgi:hypothetical protein
VSTRGGQSRGFPKNHLASQAGVPRSTTRRPIPPLGVGGVGTVGPAQEKNALTASDHRRQPDKLDTLHQDAPDRTPERTAWPTAHFDWPGR